MTVWQPLELVTKKLPLVVTTIDDVVAPVLQVPPTFPERVTLPPAQNVMGAPLAVMVEATGGKPNAATTLSANDIAPAVERPLPISVEFAAKAIAPLTSTVP